MSKVFVIPDVHLKPWIFDKAAPRDYVLKVFSFIAKTDFSESHHRFDQCGVVMYLDSENWLKASVEYENEEFQHLG